MDVKAESKIKFETIQKEKKVSFCSFSCAVQFHQKYPNSKISTTDYLYQKPIDAAQGFYLVRSKRLLKEFEFDMPPTVAVFATREDAETTQKKLGDGKILSGFDAAEKEYR